MSEPRRLLDQATSSDVRRALLAGVGIAPPAKAEDRVWTALSAAIGAAGGALSVSAAAAASAKGGGAVATSASATSAAGIAAAAKFIAIGVSAGALALGGHRAWTAMTRPPRAPVVAPAQPPSPPRSELGSPVPSPARAIPDAPSPAAPSRPQPQPAIAFLAPRPPSRPAARERRPDESSIVLDARQALHRGAAAEALAILRRAKKSLAGGGLEQERDLLEIESLVALGSRDDASRRATDFVEAYPDSPYIGRIRSLIR